MVVVYIFISNNSSILDIREVSCTDNMILNNGNGSTIYIRDGSFVKISNSSFINNRIINNQKANTAAVAGGAIYSIDNSVLDIEDTSFMNNRISSLYILNNNNNNIYS